MANVSEYSDSGAPGLVTSLRTYAEGAGAIMNGSTEKRWLGLITAVCLILCLFCPGQCEAIENEDEGDRSDSLMLTILYDNTSVSDSIIADHGFSCLIESEDHTCLFDAGRVSNILVTNATELGVNYSAVEHVFISHIHNDHIGGLLNILSECNKPTLCMPVSYPRQEGESFGDQADRHFEAMLDELRPFVSEVVQREGFTCLGGDFYTTGTIDRRSYEQTLVVPTSRGLVIITGCAHPGIVEIVSQVKQRMDQDVYYVMGGFHLNRTDSAQVETIANELRRMTKYIGPCHCTGEKAKDIFRAIFREDYIEVGAGLKLELGRNGLRSVDSSL